MADFKKEHLALVLGLSVSGLGVIRSLGREGIKVVGFDYNRGKDNEGFYSKYLKAKICPHPVHQSKELVEFLINQVKGQSKKPILFPTADEFVKFISVYRDRLKQYFLFNISSFELIDAIIDKKRQYEIATNAGIDVPETFCFESQDKLNIVAEQLAYPAIIKGRFSFSWREELGGTFKGFKVNNPADCRDSYQELFDRNIPVIIQKVILGPNHNHFKFCVYRSKQGEILAKFSLVKIRQYPKEFGMGCCVESLQYKQLEQTGEKLFTNIDYKGVGSAEFKLDPSDQKLKLIELNPRFWLQNEQATYCGVNFARQQYLDLSRQEVPRLDKFKIGVKWIDPICDIKSFAKENHRDKLFLFRWLRLLSVCRIFSVFSWQDLRPFLKSIGYGLIFLRFAGYIVRAIRTNKE